MKINELIDVLKCHVMRHGDCEVELFIADKIGMPKGESRDFAASLATVGHGPVNDHKHAKQHPRAVLKGTIPNKKKRVKK